MKPFFFKTSAVGSTKAWHAMSDAKGSANLKELSELGNSCLCRSQGPPGIHLLQPVILTEFNAYTVNETLDEAKGYIPKESDLCFGK